MRKLKLKILFFVELIQEIYILLLKSSAIVHIGHHSSGKKMKSNVGDPILYKELENLYDYVTREKHTWIHRSVRTEVTRIEVLLYNKFAKAVFVGGHGLLMIDTGKNDNSGWQLNISLSNLERLKCPLAILAIGYNTFKGQENFNEIFVKHINKCVEKSVLFGLRNYGSIKALSNYLTEQNSKKICFQPCPTTMLSLFENIALTKKEECIGICVAFDRFASRFGNHFDQIFSILMEYAAEWERKGFKVMFYVHNPTDMDSYFIKLFKDNGYQLTCLSGKPIEEIYHFYQTKKLIIGMRGHSLMIPWGLQTPVLSLTTQNKQKWFIETTGKPERSVEIGDNNLLCKLNDFTRNIINSYDSEIDAINKKQHQFLKTTQTNFLYIKNHI